MNEKCNICWCEMLIKRSDYWLFRWCSWYPKCKWTKNVLKENKEFKQMYWKNKWELLKSHWNENYSKQISTNGKKLNFDYNEWYVYILYIKKISLYKIWYTIDPDSRIRAIAKEYKMFDWDYYKDYIDDVKLIKLYKTYNYKTLEKQLHFMFMDVLKHKDEYFDLSTEDIERLDFNTICWIEVTEEDLNSN